MLEINSIFSSMDLEVKDCTIIELISRIARKINPRKKEIVIERGFEGYYASHNSHNLQGEVHILLSIIKRIAGTRQPFEGVNINCYRYDGSENPRASLHVTVGGEE